VLFNHLVHLMRANRVENARRLARDHSDKGYAES